MHASLGQKTCANGMILGAKLYGRIPSPVAKVLKVMQFFLYKMQQSSPKYLSGEEIPETTTLYWKHHVYF